MVDKEVMNVDSLYLISSYHNIHDNRFGVITNSRLTNWAGKLLAL